jgi:hypothetical protein
MDPYTPLIKSDKIIVSLEKPYSVPVIMEYDRPSELDISPMTIAIAKALAAQENLKQLNRIDTDYIDSEERIVENQPKEIIAEESIMSTKRKTTIELSSKTFFPFS